MSDVDRAGRDTWLPDGVVLLSLTRHQDDRGSLVEFRRDSDLGPDAHMVQWNHVRSEADVLRGIHLHHRHADYLYMAAGHMQLALVEARRASREYSRATVIEFCADEPQGIYIPPGVAHGFFFPEPSVLVYGVTDYWDPDDELGCRWDDPALSLDWSPAKPSLSDRDQRAGSFEAMVDAYEARIRSEAASKCLE